MPNLKESKINKINNVLKKGIKMLSKYRNEYLFENEIGLLNYVIANNPYLIECIKMELLEFLEVDGNLLKLVLDYLDALYERLF